MSWEHSYRIAAVPWPRTQLNPAYRYWFDQLPDEAFGRVSVAVPGCGSSLEPLALARRGATVTRIDVAPAAVEAQRRMFADETMSATIVCADIAEWRPRVLFDLIYEQTCLCAIGPSERPGYERFTRESR